MQNKKLFLVLILIYSSFFQLQAQYQKSDENYKDCFIGSTFAMLGNFSKINTPDFVQLNLGYRLTEKDVISVELKTWKYAWSLGIPYGPLKEAPETEFPGYIREKGFAIAYQRFLWKGLYAGVHVMSAWQTFVNKEGTKFDDGFQIFNTYRLGYYIKLFKGKFFIEPSIGITHRPYHTKMPDSFKTIDDQYSKLFIGEPGLHFGYNF